MTPTQTKSSVEPHMCPGCEQPVRFVEVVCDMRTKRTVRIFECTNCMKLVWEH